jgi:hypothetical protein
MELILYLIIIVLVISLGYSIYRWIKLWQRQVILYKELNSQSLDYHLKKIEELGYEFILKSRKDFKPKKEKAKNKKTKKIDELLDE